MSNWEWRFQEGELVPYTIPWDEEVKGDSQKERSALGFAASPVTLGSHPELFIELYSPPAGVQRAIPDQFLAEVTVGDLVHAVLIPDLPALLLFLTQWEPVIRLAMDSQREAELREHLDTHAEANRWRDCRYCRTDPVPQLITWGNGTYRHD